MCTRSSHPLPRLPAVLYFLSILVVAPYARGEPPAPLTLEKALSMALAHNARLPVSRVESRIASEATREASATLGPQASIEGVVRYPFPGAYGEDVSEHQLLAVIRQPLYMGGATRAGLRAARARQEAARLRTRIDEKDVELEVRKQYAELLAGEAIVGVRREALQRLDVYRLLVTARVAGGLGVAADVARAESQLAGEEADLEGSLLDVELARANFNDLLGRAPDMPIRLTVLPDPTPALRGSGSASGESPDVAASAAALDAAAAEFAGAGAGRLPQLDLVLDSGVLGGGGIGNGPPQPGWFHAQAGASITVNLSWPIFDLGIYDARLAQARLAEDRARAEFRQTQRQAELARTRAQLSLQRLASEFSIRGRMVPAAYDSYLRQESLYRSGQTSSLDVIDAWSTWRDALLARVQTTLAYRTAEAEYFRWTVP